MAVNVLLTKADLMFPEGQGKRVPFARDGTAAEKTNELLVNAKDAINELHSLRPPAGRHAGPSRGPAGRPHSSLPPLGVPGPSGRYLEGRIPRASEGARPPQRLELGAREPIMLSL